jgi:ankyrin repeat protein
LSKTDDARTAFLEAAVWHGSLTAAEALLTVHPWLARSDIHTAAVVGDDEAVRAFLAADRSLAAAKSGPFAADPLVYLCLSKYLRLDPARSDRFLRAAASLLDAGANPDSGFWWNGEFETAMYGAAGVAHHAELTRLLLERGADPNDGEVVYHAPETRDNAALRLLVETGRLTPESKGLMLLRKLDWHDADGVQYLLEHGAAANHKGPRGWTALHHSLARGNGQTIIELLLDHGADALAPIDGRSAIAAAARHGRGDVLDLFARRGVAAALDGVDRLIAACALGDSVAVQSIAQADRAVMDEVIPIGGELLAAFASSGNAAGIGLLLDLGVSAAARWPKGDGYFVVAPDSLAIHVAAWRAHPAVVKLLIARGSPVDVPDGHGRTPLALAVKACVDSYWTDRRSPESVAALMDAGASVDGVMFPSGYDEVDALLLNARI